MRANDLVKIAGIALGGVLAVRLASRLLPRKRMDGEVAFITGGSRGLGLAIARECARRGARIAICGRDEAALESAVQMLRSLGCEALALRCDVRERPEVENALERAYTAFGRLDLLVNNAGTIAVGPFETMTESDYEDALRTHFWALYYAVEAALPLFERQGRGRVVNVTSIGGKVSVPHLLPYSVSKFAAVGYSEGLRSELKRKKVSVTTIVPGLMRTGSPRNAWFKGRHRKEYTWFALSDALPGASIAAHSAARAIVDAALAGKAELVLSLPARAAVALEGIAPNVLLAALQMGGRLLPANGGVENERMSGAESETPLTASPLTALSRKAERAYNQV